VLPHAFFKRIPDTAKLVQEITIDIQNMYDDQIVQNLQGRSSKDDLYNQALLNYLAGKAKQI
jgi:predicted Zn-dependent protease with MMP-like domain